MDQVADCDPADTNVVGVANYLEIVADRIQSLNPLIYLLILGRGVSIYAQM